MDSRDFNFLEPGRPQQSLYDTSFAPAQRLFVSPVFTWRYTTVILINNLITRETTVSQPQQIMHDGRTVLPITSTSESGLS